MPADGEAGEQGADIAELGNRYQPEAEGEVLAAVRVAHEDAHDELQQDADDHQRRDDAGRHQVRNAWNAHHLERVDLL